jgi:hypothetical protein
MQDQLQSARPHTGHPRRWIAAIFTTTLLIPGISGCWKPVPPPNIHVNPNPTERYRFVLTLPDPPPHGEPKVTAYINYYIENNGRCIPSDKTKALGGHTQIVARKIPLDVTQISKTKYEATYYMDHFKNEDYYGKGICRWGAVPEYVFYLNGAGYSSGARKIVDRRGALIKQRCPLRQRSGLQPCFDMNAQIKLSDNEVFFVLTTTYKE